MTPVVTYIGTYTDFSPRSPLDVHSFKEIAQPYLMVPGQPAVTDPQNLDLTTALDSFPPLKFPPLTVFIRLFAVALFKNPITIPVFVACDYECHVRMHRPFPSLYFLRCFVEDSLLSCPALNGEVRFLSSHDLLNFPTEHNNSNGQQWKVKGKTRRIAVVRGRNWRGMTASQQYHRKIKI